MFLNISSWPSKSFEFCAKWVLADFAPLVRAYFKCSDSITQEPISTWGWLIYKFRGLEAVLILWNLPTLPNHGNAFKWGTILWTLLKALLHAVSPYKKRLYKKRPVELLRVKKRRLVDFHQAKKRISYTHSQKLLNQETTR